MNTFAFTRVIERLNTARAVEQKIAGNTDVYERESYRRRAPADIASERVRLDLAAMRGQAARIERIARMRAAGTYEEEAMPGLIRLRGLQTGIASKRITLGNDRVTEAAWRHLTPKQRKRWNKARPHKDRRSNG